MSERRLLRSLDEVSTPLADHDRGCIGVPADDFGHNAGISDPEPLDTTHLQRWVDDAIGVTPHATCADRVIDCVCAAADQLIERVIIVYVNRIAITRTELL